jgi:tetratricopeptide (TPR) repeat protein
MRAALLLAAALVCWQGAQFVGQRAALAANVTRNPDELLYLPSGRVLKLASFGFELILADLLWLRAIQYYGEHRLTDRNYDQAERLFQVIYVLDPHFKGATRFGALILAQDAHDPHGALALLRRAEKDNPQDWEYPFDQGFILQTVLRDYAAAGAAYQRASRLPGAPDLAVRLAGFSYMRLGDRETAREVWRSILCETENEMMRRIAERSLINLHVEEQQEILTQIVGTFREREGRLPRGWPEVVAKGLLAEPPREPFGGLFLIDGTTGCVHSTTLVDREMARQRDVIAAAVRWAQAEEGAYPGSFAEMVKQGLIDAEPSAPLGIELYYDAATGRVAWRPPWPQVEPGQQGEGRG